MAKRKKTGSSSKKKPIEQYAHKGKKRANNPPVGGQADQQISLSTRLTSGL